jgi:hypothetical protein
VPTLETARRSVTADQAGRLREEARSIALDDAVAVLLGE